MSRQFGDKVPIFESEQRSLYHKGQDVKAGSEELFNWIRNNEIGSDVVFETPFGKRQVVYCDYTASARSIGPIESYLQQEVLPLYGNTHSSVTVTAEQTTLFLHEARQEIRAMTGAGDGDAVLFTGSGATSAVELLVHLMKPNDDLIVVHSIHEHHSNLLPWRKVAKGVHCIRENDEGRVDQAHLFEVLKTLRRQHPDCTILGAFSACSNITGVLMDVQETTKILRRFNCLSIWDYAAAAPYVPIEVNGPNPIDAVFFSGHKFIGGVATPGVLVVKRSLIRATDPKRMGGGTVFFVNDSNEWYLKEAEYREEGGTPDSVGAIRLALAVKLKRAIGDEIIANADHRISRKFLDRVKLMKNVVLLGPPTYQRRIPVFSFLIKNHQTGLFFHHNYISALLNDLFGIQSRSGCMCAGPYAQHLLGIDLELSTKFIEALKESDLDRTHLRRVGEYSSQEVLRPGFTRISIPYFWDDQKLDYVLGALEFISKNAGNFIHLYQLNCDSAEWHHHKQRTFHSRKWLGHVSFSSMGMRIDLPKANPSETFVRIERCLDAAQTELVNAQIKKAKISVPDGRLAIDPSHSALRWYVLPIELSDALSSKPQIPPFTPRSYMLSAKDCSPSNSTLSVETTMNEAIDLRTYDEKRTSDGESVPFCEPCNSSLISDLSQECPLDPAETGKGRMGELDTDERPEEAKTLDEWNCRTVVDPVELTAEEETRLPWHTPPLEMYKRVTEAIHGLDMIKDGDKILVCLSGGKDSLSLLHILHFYQLRCFKNQSTKFSLGAITVDPGSSAYNPRPLIEYCRSLNIPYYYEEQDIIGAARRLPNLRSICAFCSRMKRGRLAAAAQHHGWNVLAMGQHLDDLAESFFIAAFQNGNLSTMKAQYTTRDANLRVIRPLIFVREKALRDFSDDKKLPVVAENCPACFNQATERHRMKQLLAQQELVFPDLFHSLRSALRPLVLVDSASTDQMRMKAIENIVRQNRGKAKV